MAMAERNERAESLGIVSYNAQIQRAYNPLWRLGYDEPMIFNQDGTLARVVISADFWSNSKAMEFQQKVLELMGVFNES